MITKILKETFKDSINIKELHTSANSKTYEISIEETYNQFLDSLGDNLNLDIETPTLKFDLVVELNGTKEVNYTLNYCDELILDSPKEIDVCSALADKGSVIINTAKKGIILSTVDDIDKVVDERRNCMFYNLSEDVYHKTSGLSKSQLSQIIDRTYAHFEHGLETPRKDTKALSLGRAFHCYILTPELFEKRFFVAPKLDLRKKDDKKISIRNKLTKSHLEQISSDQLELIKTMEKNISSHPIIPHLLKSSKKEVSFYWENSFNQISRGRMDAFVEEPTEELKKLLKDLVPDYRGQKIIWDLKTEDSDASLDAYSRKMMKYHTHVQGAYYSDGVSSLVGEEVIFLLVVIEKTAPHCVAWYKLGDASIDKGQQEYKEALRRIYSQKQNQWKGFNLECQIIDIPYFKIGKAA